MEKTIHGSGRGVKEKRCKPLAINLKRKINTRDKKDTRVYGKERKKKKYMPRKADHDAVYNRKYIYFAGP